MKEIGISEITLREEGRGYNLSFKEKIEIARLLDNLNVNVIETAPINNGRKDVLLLHSIASVIKNSTLSCPVGLDIASVDQAYDAIKSAKSPRLHIMAAVSTVQMEYMHHMKPKVMLDSLAAAAKHATELLNDVEVSLVDATRAEDKVLFEAIKAAVNNGAKTVTLCDSAGEMLPAEFEAFIKKVIENVPEIESVKLGIECSDSLHMASACTVSCIKNGATQVKTAMLSNGYADLASIAHIFRAKADALDIGTTINMPVLDSTVAKIRLMTSAVGAKSPFDAGTNLSADGLKLGKNDDISSVNAAVASLGYTLADEELAKVYDEFVNISKIKNVGAKELEAIIASVAMQVAPTYKLKSYVINSSNIIAPTAHIELEKDGKVLSGVCIGDGPIDAAFLAIEQITGQHFELDDFEIQAVTEGREAMGSSIVKLRNNGKPYSGKGISTDIIGASINAYVNALNKICFEERGNE